MKPRNGVFPHRAMMFARNHRWLLSHRTTPLRYHAKPYIAGWTQVKFIAGDHPWRNVGHRTTPLSKRATWRFIFRRGMSGRVRAMLRRRMT